VLPSIGAKPARNYKILEKAVKILLKNASCLWQRALFALPGASCFAKTFVKSNTTIVSNKGQLFFFAFCDGKMPS
jgi:hypothetical protein